MEFDLANQWPLIATPIGMFTFLWLALARRWLITGGEYKERVADLKTAHADAITQRDTAHAATIADKDATIKDKNDTITHLRAVNKKAMDALERIADTQEENLRTTDIVKTVMQHLQAQAQQPRTPTGPIEKVSK